MWMWRELYRLACSAAVKFKAGKSKADRLKLEIFALEIQLVKYTVS